MVLVILGTQDKVFPRLLEMVEDAINKGVIKDKVIVQNGNTKYETKKLELVGFVSSKKFEKLISEADYIITHGGVGSIINSLNHNKKVIALPRLSSFGEHENDHQKEIVHEFSNLGFILDGSDDLVKQIKRIPKFKPKQYKSNNTNFVKVLTDFIDKDD